jgi:hypothetical protein
MMMSFPNTAEFCYIRVLYESQDILNPQQLIFRVYFGKQQSILSSSMLSANPTGSPTTPNLDHEDPENMTAVNKTQSEKIKRLQLMARV